MAITYGLQVWDTQAFPLVDTVHSYLQLSNVNEQRQLLMQQKSEPTENALEFAEILQQLAETLSNVHPWMKTYLQDLSGQFRQQSTVVLTIKTPDQPSKFTILAYFVMMVASQNRMVTYNAAGDFFILPLEDKKMMSNFPELYKNNLDSIDDLDGEAHLNFMKIYRQALIAEGLVKFEDLIDWDQYSMRDDDCDIKASKMAVDYVKAYFLKKGTEFIFQEKGKLFIVPIKKVGDIEFELVLDVWAVMRDYGIGRIGIHSYLSVRHESALKNHDFLELINKDFKTCFGEDIKPISILAIFDMFDYREKISALYANSRIYLNIVSENNTWPDLFAQIENLIDTSIKALFDIHDVKDFLSVFEKTLAIGMPLRDLTRFQMTESLCVCYLMYAKLFKPSLFSVLTDRYREIFKNQKSKEKIFHLIDCIENYEVPA